MFGYVLCMFDVLNKLFLFLLIPCPGFMCQGGDFTNHNGMLKVFSPTINIVYARRFSSSNFASDLVLSPDEPKKGTKLNVELIPGDVIIFILLDIITKSTSSRLSPQKYPWIKHQLPHILSK